MAAPMTELQMVVCASDVGFFYSLLGHYHRDPLAFKGKLESFVSGKDERLQQPIEKLPGIPQGKPEEANMLYRTVVDECDCGKCYNRFVRPSREPWRSSGDGVFYHCAEEPVIVTDCAVSKFVGKGYIYKSFVDLDRQWKREKDLRKDVRLNRVEARADDLKLQKLELDVQKTEIDVSRAVTKNIEETVAKAAKTSRAPSTISVPSRTAKPVKTKNDYIKLATDKAYRWFKSQPWDEQLRLTNLESEWYEDFGKGRVKMPVERYKTIAKVYPKLKIDGEWVDPYDWKRNGGDTEKYYDSLILTQWKLTTHYDSYVKQLIESDFTKDSQNSSSKAPSHRSNLTTTYAKSTSSTQRSRVSSSNSTLRKTHTRKKHGSTVSDTIQE